MGYNRKKRNCKFCFNQQEPSKMWLWAGTWGLHLGFFPGPLLEAPTLAAASALLPVQAGGSAASSSPHRLHIALSAEGNRSCQK